MTLIPSYNGFVKHFVQDVRPFTQETVYNLPLTKEGVVVWPGCIQ